ncbi:MAG TPA: phenylalanine--tRNA ligase subunit beta, partial [Bacteroidetes bacterium]|nr:phenylalanine--tRNA ligase subunit beta [Bacteroidota bacterium]
TKVDVGKGELLDIVCGAPNVAEGQKVLVATVGTVLYSPEGEEWKIKKGKIRGEVSEGMICAEDEVGLGTSHDGIMVLPDDTPIGINANEYFNVEEDFVYDIDLTPNRSDATSHLGVAKDLAAYLKINNGHSGHIKMPDVDGFKKDYDGLKIDVVVEDTKKCPRYSGVVITDIEIKESPDWLKNKLTAIDVRPINNIVDITNFVLHELGQPLHAFDADKIKGKTLRIKTLYKDTPFLALDEMERKLRDEDLIICDDDSAPLCIGGVFGGLESGVSDNTKNIFLESAYFDPQSIRVTSMKHNLRTDAAMVFEKGADPNMTVFALKRAALLMKELANAKISSDIVDIYPEPVKPAEIKVFYSHVNRLIGIDIPKNKIKEILDSLHFDIIEEKDNYLILSIPTNKADVTREADVIEEILRIYGLNNVPIPSKVSISVNHSDGKENYEIRNYLSSYLTNQGFFESMSLSLAESEKYIELFGFNDEELVYINNTSNVNLNIMRPEMLLSGLENIVFNQNRQIKDINLYEFGRSYRMDAEDILEKEYLTLYMAGKKFDESWNVESKSNVDFYTLKAHVNNILTKMNVHSAKVFPIENDDRFDYGLEVKKGENTVVKYGKVSSVLARKIDIKSDVFYAEIDFENLVRFSDSKMHVDEISKYPVSRRDVAMIIDKKIKFEEIEKLANKAVKKILKSVNLFDVYSNDEQLGEGKVSYAVSLIFEDKTKTLNDKVIDKAFKKFIYLLEQELGAKVRK